MFRAYRFDPKLARECLQSLLESKRVAEALPIPFFLTPKGAYFPPFLLMIDVPSVVVSRNEPLNYTRLAKLSSNKKCMREFGSQDAASQ